MPTRKTARRKAAKEAAKRGKLAELSDDEEPVDPDSDTDPAWMPPVDEVSSVPPYGWDYT